jgi:hypothetical protein
MRSRIKFGEYWRRECRRTLRVKGSSGTVYASREVCTMDPSVLVGRGAEPSCSSNPIIASGAYLGPKIPRPQFHAKPGPTIVFMGPIRSIDRPDVWCGPRTILRRQRVLQ